MLRDEQIELNPAYSWDCVECGREHFERAVRLEADDETMAEMREQDGIDPELTGAFFQAPARVTCRDCGTSFETKHWAGD